MPAQASPPPDADESRPAACPVDYPGVVGPSWLVRSELDWLIGRLPDAGLVVEVGTASGATAARIADARPGLAILSVDPFPDHDAAHVVAVEPCRVDNWRRNAATRPALSLWLGTFAALVAIRPRLRAAAVVVDGAHEEADTAADLRLAARVLARDGTLFVHDYGEADWPGVRRAVDRFARRAGFEAIGQHRTLRAMRRCQKFGG